MGTAAKGREAFFEPFSSQNLDLAGRIVMAPMGRAHAENGLPAAHYAEYFCRRAEGGVALMITGATTIDHPLADYDGTGPALVEEARDAWKSMVGAIHDAGGKIISQLWHTGMARHVSVIGGPAIGPSGLAIADLSSGKPSGRAMNTSDMAAVRDAFVRSARLAQEVGFDGVAIHCGHGFLLDQFLWPATNRRTDRYGGTPENRARFPAEVIAAVRAAVGPAYPLLARVSQFKIEAYEARIADTPDELGRLLAPLKAAGVDIFDCSQREIAVPAFNGSNLNLAGWAKKLTGLPAIAVGSVGLGGLFSEEEAANPGAALPPVSLDGIDTLGDRMHAGEFDLLAIGRSLLGDAEWATKVREGRDDEITPLTLDNLTKLI